MWLSTKFVATHYSLFSGTDSSPERVDGSLQVHCKHNQVVYFNRLMSGQRVLHCGLLLSECIPCLLTVHTRDWWFFVVHSFHFDMVQSVLLPPVTPADRGML